MIELEGQDAPEVHLWRAVITQAISDARLDVSIKRKESLRERDHAREWLLGDSRDFRRVCDMAMLDPGAVLDRAKNLAMRGWPPERTNKRHRSTSHGDDLTGIEQARRNSGAC